MRETVQIIEAGSPPTQAFELLTRLDLMLLVQATTPTDPEWDAYLRAVADPSRARLPRCIVITDGAHPTRAQQARMATLLKGRQSLVAVISSATAIRFMVSALSLVNKGIKAYSPTERAKAFSHVGLAPAEYPNVEVALDRLHAKLANRQGTRAHRNPTPPTVTSRSEGSKL